MTAPAQEMTDSKSARSSRSFWLLAVALALPWLLWPGDVPWVYDEPQLIANAMDANDRGELARHGLMGTAGVHYGPLPTWGYQLALKLTSDLSAIVLVKTFIGLAALLLILSWLGRRLGLAQWPLALVLVSPYIWYFSRIIWDNGSPIWLSAALGLVYLRFAENPRPRTLWLGMLLTVVMFYVHVKTFFAIGAFVICTVALHRPWFRAHWRAAVPAYAAALLAVAPYLLQIAGEMAFNEQYKVGLGQAFWDSATGIRFCSFIGWGAYYLPEALQAGFFVSPVAVKALLGLSALAYLLCAAGIVQFIAELKSRPRAMTAADRFYCFSLLVIILHVAFYAVTRHGVHPQYFIGVWFAWFVFLWRFVASAPWPGPIRWGFWLSQGATACLWLMAMLFVHVSGGSRGLTFGPVLQEQVRVAKELVRYPAGSAILLHVPNLRDAPNGLETLMRLYRSEADTMAGEPVVLSVEYAHAHQATGWLRLQVRPKESLP